MIVGASSTADILRREVRDGWTGRVRLESGEVLGATFDGERRCFVDDDGMPFHAVAAVDLTRRVPQRLRTDKLTVRLLPGYVTRIQALADSEGETVAELLERITERCELEAEMRGTVGT